MLVEITHISDNGTGQGISDNHEEIDLRFAKGIDVPEDKGRYHLQGGFFSSHDGSKLPRRLFLVEGYEHLPQSGHTA